MVPFILINYKELKTKTIFLRKFQGDFYRLISKESDSPKADLMLKQENISSIFFLFRDFYGFLYGLGELNSHSSIPYTARDRAILSTFLYE